MRIWTRYEVVIFVCCTLLSLIVFAGILLYDYKTQIEPWQPYENILDLILSRYHFIDIAPPTFPIGRVVPLDVNKILHGANIPLVTECYFVRLDPKEKPILVNGEIARNIIGLLATHGLDWDCDFSEETGSMITYSPTNGTQSNGDIFRLITP